LNALRTPVKSKRCFTAAATLTVKIIDTALLFSLFGSQLAKAKEALPFLAIAARL
jgi:hypothetical protein